MPVFCSAGAPIIPHALRNLGSWIAGKSRTRELGKLENQDISNLRICKSGYMEIQIPEKPGAWNIMNPYPWKSMSPGTPILMYTGTNELRDPYS